ncbi:hypothetical protein GLE_4538 [Lysobacter enzymogenes]|uniref:Uncharacterized protein n=1 Tax=Lysobacter enzymogenes TaxID=69 RepID=A0A0S2DMQ2_LYSEN|nr:hypothetical protein GLE_4538 [Lysobacter enzymogenes]
MIRPAATATGSDHGRAPSGARSRIGGAGSREARSAAATNGPQAATPLPAPSFRRKPEPILTLLLLRCVGRRRAKSKWVPAFAGMTVLELLAWKTELREAPAQPTACRSPAAARPSRCRNPRPSSCFPAPRPAPLRNNPADPI